MKSIYEYLPLSPDASHVRLLILHPGSDLDEISVSLTVVDLEDPMKYEALSYVWGSKDSPVGIHVGIEEISSNIHSRCQSLPKLCVTKNLAVALGHLRDVETHRVLWIDAICIDQSTTCERSQQVAMMSDIYQRAMRVIVWLGPEADDSALAMGLLADLGAKVQVDWMSYKMKPSSSGKFEPHWADATIELPYQASEMAALERLVDRPWFERLWVVQEVLSAKADVLVVCGSSAMSWKTFHNNALCCLLYKNVRHAKSARFDHRLRSILAIFAPLQDGVLIDTIGNTRALQCQDPKDRIYAVLGIVRDTLSIKPDYTKTTIQVYQEVVRQYVECNQRLDVLNACENIKGDQIRRPTWVPDWSRPQERIAMAQGEVAGAAKASAFFCGDDILRVAAVKIATVATVDRMNVAGKGPHEVELEIRKLAPTGLFTATYRTGCSLLQAFTGTLICNNLADIDPPRELHPTRQSSMQLVTTIIQSIEQKQPSHSAKDAEFIKWVALCGRGMSFVSTKQGYVGLAPSETRKGDIVCALLGYSACMVLRSSTKAEFNIVGECFLYGLSNGEAILGPLPGDIEPVWKYHDSDKTFRWAYRHKETKKTEWDDPRLRLFGLNCGQGRSPPVIDAAFLKQTNINIEYFNLV